MDNRMASPTQEGRGTTSQPDDTSSTYVYYKNCLCSYGYLNINFIVAQT